MFEICGSEEKGLRVLVSTSHFDDRDAADLKVCKMFIMK